MQTLTDVYNYRQRYNYINHHSAVAAIFISIVNLYFHLLIHRFIILHYPYTLRFFQINFILIELCLFSTILISNLNRYDRSIIRSQRRYQQCTKCGFERPPRTHHCSTCRRCIPRMCHHCILLGVCIGQHNYKPFIQLLFHAVVTAFILAAATIKPALDSIWHALHPNLTKKHQFSDTAVLAHASYFSVALIVVLAPYLITHLYLIALNWTVLEAFTLPPKKKLFPPYLARKSPYSDGFLNNFRDALGSLFLPYLLLPYVRNSDFKIPRKSTISVDSTR